MASAEVLRSRVQSEPARSSDLLVLIHDLCQPLAVVSWLLAMVEHTAELPDVAARRIALATREVDFLCSLLRDAMTADIEPPGSSDLAGRPWPAEQPGPAADNLVEQTGPPDVVELTSVVRSIVTPLTQVRPGAVDLQLTGPTLAVIAEPAIRRVLNNLIHNALRAGGENGRLWVRVEGEGSNAVLSVEDDGPGFGRISRGRSLGLVSAATQVIAAGGSLELCRSGLGGLRVSVRLPTSRDGEQA